MACATAAHMHARSTSRAALAACLLVAACSGPPTGSGASESNNTSSSSSARDWNAHPAIVQIDTADEIFALSDPHGGYAALGALLQSNHLISGFSSDWKNASSVKWTGGGAILVVAGDLIDKGPESLGVIDLLRAVERQAAATGGRVVVTMGNHEAEFLADPENNKATSTGKDAEGIDRELKARGVDPKELAHGRDAEGRGKWLLSLPFGVRIKKWFFAHSGNTAGDSLPSLEKRLRHSIDNNGYGDKDITGNDSILEAQGWYGNQDKDSTGKKYADALGVNHIVFGHDPGAFGEHGNVRASKDGSLIKIDVMMGLDESGANTGGLLLHVRTKGNDSAEVLDSRGTATPLL